MFAFLFREKQIQKTSIIESKTSKDWKHPFIYQNFKLKENNTSKLSFTFLKTIDETSAKIYIKQKYANKFSFLEIECNNENSSFDLVNQLLDKPVNNTSNESIEIQLKR